ncbi:unnamed protein product [Amoebophrya sp. A25]|nr:unnamed protein product [Amoebophrya sp. A25]|eukprot:GSA25T00025114001.1
MTILGFYLERTTTPSVFVIYVVLVSIRQCHIHVHSPDLEQAMLIFVPLCWRKS